MKHFALLTLVLILVDLSQDTAESRDATNTLAGQVPMPSVRASAIEKAADIVAPTMIWTNGVPFDNGRPQLGSTSQEIELTDVGCEATWGRHKALFDADIASHRPIRVTMPDGKKVAFRPTFLVLANRATGQQILIAEITNRIAQIIQPDRVVWTNAFDRSGPEIDVEYHYTASGLEQNVVFRENPLKNLPSEWKLADVVIECWTEAFFDSAPATIESKTAQIRGESGAAKALVAEDQDIGWNSMKIVAGGRAFSVAPFSKARPGAAAENDVEQDSLPVSKVWTEIDDGGSKRTFIIETLDALGAKPKLDALKDGRHASATRPASGRSEFLRLHASSAQLRRDGRQASTFPSNQRTASATSERVPILVNVKGDPIKAGFVLDFAIVNTVAVPPGIVSWWPAGGNALDAIANHNDGFLSNGVSYASGKVGQGFSFGAYSNYVKIPNSTSLNPTNALTIDCWVYLDKYGSNHMLVGKDNQGNQRQYALTVSPGKTFRACIGITNGIFYYIDSATLAATGVWTHVAMTYSAANSNLSFYLNGHLDTNATVVGSAISTTEPLFIGNAPRGSPYWWSYDPPGRVDEVDIFNRALSASEIQSIYDAGAAGKYNPNCVSPSTNVVAWWPAEENSYDIAGTNFAYPFNGPSYAAGAVRSGFSFDGVNDYLVASNSPSLNPTNALTVEAWVYLSSFDNWHHPIISKDGCDHDRQYLLTVYSNQKFAFCIGTPCGFCYTYGTNVVPVGAWTHVAMTYDSATQKLILYVNGVKDTELPDISGPIISTTQPVFIGGAPHSCFPYYFPGLIDEPTIYNRALTATEISAIYSAGSAGKCACYVTNQTYTCLSSASVFFGPVAITKAVVCLGDSNTAWVATASVNGTIRQTLQYSDCNTAYFDTSISPTIETNWFVLNSPDGSVSSSNGLSTAIDTGMAGIYNLTFYSRYTNAFPPCTNEQTISVSTNVTVIELVDLSAPDYVPITDDGITKTYVVCLDPTNATFTNILVAAVLTPTIDENALPNTWTLSGGIGVSKTLRFVDATHVGTNVIFCTAGGFALTNVIIVASEADNDYDGVSDCQELIDETDPNDFNSASSYPLGYWRFDNTNTWCGEQGQLPLSATNIDAVIDWSGTAVKLRPNASAILRYRDVETNGFSNINCRRGTIRFWFKPDWGSANAAGQGPQGTAQVIELGHASTDASYGQWTLCFDASGNVIRLVTQGDGVATTNLAGSISWISNQWHQVAITYSSSNSSLYVDGLAVATNGIGIVHYPGPSARAQGFTIGSNAYGTNQAKGEFDELQTFNYELTGDMIAWDYATAAGDLSAPTLSVVSFDSETNLEVTISHGTAVELVSSVSSESISNPATLMIATNCGNSWFGRQTNGFQTPTVGLNITKLPAPAIYPNGTNFTSSGVALIVLGAENFTNMINNVYRTELGRISTGEELNNGVALAQSLRSTGWTDEQIRAYIINNVLRSSSEYATLYPGVPDTYVTNTNYIVEYCTTSNSGWLTYTGTIQISQSVTLLARVRKIQSSDRRTTYAYVASDPYIAQFTVIPAAWFTNYFGANYLTNTNALPSADPDGDGLANWQEYQFGTNPLNPDTDHDGRTDGQEIGDATDPLDADTDYDGRTDGQEFIDSTDPTNPARFQQVRLAYWRFDDTNCVGDGGQLPIVRTNTQLVITWSTNAIALDSTNAAILSYRDVETNALPNFNCRHGTVRFWFRPSWGSIGMTNGAGPGSEGRLIELGSRNSTNGWWALVLSSDGSTLSFITSSNSLLLTNLSVAVSFDSNSWHQIVLTYDAQSSGLYLDGLALTNQAAGIVGYPNRTERAKGFRIGSDANGFNQARGQFDELETFNYVIGGPTVASDYLLAVGADRDGNGLPDLWEFRKFGVVGVNPNGDADGDHLTNLAEYQNGTDPTKTDTDNDGRTDWQEIMDGTNPLNFQSKATWLVVADQPYTTQLLGSPPSLVTWSANGTTYFAISGGILDTWYDLYGSQNGTAWTWVGRMRVGGQYVLTNPAQSQTYYTLGLPKDGDGNGVTDDGLIVLKWYSPIGH